MEQTITIPLAEYDELKHKAEAYDTIRANNSAAGKASSASLTPEQRRERSKKAIAARWAKTHNKSNINLRKENENE